VDERIAAFRELIRHVRAVARGLAGRGPDAAFLATPALDALLRVKKDLRV